MFVIITHAITPGRWSPGFFMQPVKIGYPVLEFKDVITSEHPATTTAPSGHIAWRHLFVMSLSSSSFLMAADGDS